MTAIAPRGTPHVGIFWLVQTLKGETRLLAATCPLEQAEPYGDCLTYGPGHYETWDHWRRDRTINPALRAIVRSYEYVPLWGQAGEFVVTVGAMRVRIELHGMFGIGSTSCLFPGFYARAADLDRPFLSETGFRTFLGVSGQLVPGLTTEDFARETIAAHVRSELKGRLLPIETRRKA